ncbi:MAG: hypothetical protein IJY70_05195, partial [Clostridia bacterium]|nr:hypothetical protein [Clostridia bacterium]
SFRFFKFLKKDRLDNIFHNFLLFITVNRFFVIPTKRSVTSAWSVSHDKIQHNAKTLGALTERFSMPFSKNKWGRPLPFLENRRKSTDKEHKKNTSEI